MDDEVEEDDEFFEADKEIDISSNVNRRGPYNSLSIMVEFI
jgi:hypothetical protein